MSSEELKTFEELKAEFSKPETNDHRKKELITLMQENLKKRCGKDCGTIKCLDNKEYSLDSDNPSDLFAIDAKLRAEDFSARNDLFSEKARTAVLEHNKYGPNNPYTGK